MMIELYKLFELLEWTGLQERWQYEYEQALELYSPIVYDLGVM